MIDSAIIGLNKDFNAALRNGDDGVNIKGTGKEVLQSDDIAANTDGVHIVNSAMGSKIIGCTIGDNGLANSTIGNVTGIEFVRASDNTIGGAALADGNLISGNFNGIVVERSSGTVIQGNMIGTDGTGLKADPNRADGVVLSTATNTTIGGPTKTTGQAPGNLISGNDRFGIFTTASSSMTVIAGNLVGTDGTGAVALPNGTSPPGTSKGGGIGLRAGTTTVGGTVADARNVISGNTGDGIEINGTSEVVVQSNTIGADISGTKGLPNSGNGIALINSSNENTIGGAANPTGSPPGNLIVKNGGAGILIGGGVSAPPWSKATSSASTSTPRKPPSSWATPATASRSTAP